MTDFFKLQDDIFDLTMKVQRLCGDKTFLKLPPLSLAETNDDLMKIQALAENYLRLRRNRMARIRYYKNKRPMRGKWTHKTVFGMFVREMGSDARRDGAWRIFLAEQEIGRCDECHSYSPHEDCNGLWHGSCRDLIYFCDDVCMRNWFNDLDDETKAEVLEINDLDEI